MATSTSAPAATDERDAAFIPSVLMLTRRNVIRMTRLPSIFIPTLVMPLFFIVGAVAVLLLGLALRVGLLLRAKEMFALYKLGCPRAVMTRQVILEVLMVALAGGALCAVLLLVAHYYAGGLVGALIRL